MIAVVLQDQGYSEEANRVTDYLRAKRRLLAELEEAHTRAVYGPMEYSRDRAALLVRTAEEVIRFLNNIEEDEVIEGA